MPSGPHRQQEDAIMRSVVHLLRGLSALFWGLPLVLLAEAHTELYAKGRWTVLMAPWAANGLLLFGLGQLHRFQMQERIWRSALDRVMLLGIIHFGLTPFLFFWHAFPYQSFFGHSVHLLFISGMLYLHQLNYVIRRLAFMMPDQTLRQDTELFTGLNRRVLSFLMGLGMLYWSMGWLTAIPAPLYALLKIVDHLIPVAVVLLMVMPVSMTMTMVWKLKESIFAVLDERTSGSRVSD